MNEKIPKDRNHNVDAKNYLKIGLDLKLFYFHKKIMILCNKKLCIPP